MRWFTAINERAFQFDRYADLLAVAVHTALERTQLVPHLLYDGEDNALTAGLRACGVRIIPCRTFAYDALAAIARDRNDPNLLSIGAGTLLRIELPRLVRELGFDDRFVLYTDADVMFMTDVCPLLETLAPRLFAVGPEFDRGDTVRMNAGVMLMHVDALRASDADFRQFVTAHLAELVDQSWDQGAYRRYFGRPAIATAMLGTRWDALPPELNWKPHWGPNDRAAIVHFHGPKPQDRDALRSGALPDHMRWLAQYSGGAYDALTDYWNAQKARAARAGTMPP